MSPHLCGMRYDLGDCTRPNGCITSFAIGIEVDECAVAFRPGLMTLSAAQENKRGL